MKMMRNIVVIVSIVVISIVAFPTEDMVFADNTSQMRTVSKGHPTVEMWNMIQNYSDPKYFTGKYHSKVVTYSRTGKLSGNKYKKIVKTAKKVTAGCRSDYDRMKVLCEYTGKRIYYDYSYYNRRTRTTYYSAYDVWKNKRSVCAGYSNLYWAMLDALGIPCMMVYGKNHVFNAAYDRSTRRWVFTDVTWCSGNGYYGNGKWQKGEYDDRYFDMNLNYLLTLTSHEIYGVEGVLKNNVYYEMTPGYGNNGGDGKRFRNMKKWHWTAVCQKRKRSTLNIAPKIGGYKVTEIGYSSFYDCPHIRKVIIPTTVNKIGKYSFCLKNNRHRVKTKVISKLSKSKLRLKKNYTWWARKIVLSRK